MTRTQGHITLGLSLVVVAVIYYFMAVGAVVVNGTTSLPFNGFVMVRWPLHLWHGGYVTFKAPDAVSAEFRHLSFVKRVVGVAGDPIETRDGRVCVRGDCRTLLPRLRDKGFEALASGIIPEGKIAVFGDADNSLDSRYAVIGLVDTSDVVAVGVPAPLPNWKVLKQWFDTH